MKTSMAASPTSRFKVSSSILITAILAGLIFGFAPAHPLAASAEAIKVGLITDTAMSAENSFTWLAYQGMLRAQTDFGIIPSFYESPTETEEEFIANLAKCVADGNELCISIGFALGNATMATANANPDVKYAIVDFTYETYPSNLRSLYFEVDQPAYLAGVLARLMSQSTVVGDIGGWAIPTVTAFTEPYRNGALCANTSQGKVLLAYTNDFANPELGATVAQGMISNGADVIFAPAGATGLGAVLSATQSGQWGIGVDADFYIFGFDNGAVPGADKLLTSVLKKVDNAVYDTIKDMVLGTFTSGAKTYNMANDGTGLAPFHETDTLIAPAIKAQLEDVKKLVLAGTIDVHVLCANPGTVKVGLITDVGGSNDNSFNYLANQGLLRAETELGVVGTLYESQSQEDYATNLAQCVTDGNNLCVSVGFLMGDATLAAAEANPGTKFAIVDFTYESYPANLRSLYFEVDQPAYLAGWLARLMSQSTMVGDIGGWAIPSVTPFTESYRNGALCANTSQGTVLLAYTNDFANPALGAAVAQGMISNGADVIFAPAGATGLGAVLSATQSGQWGIGVDIDYYPFAFGNGAVPGADKLLTSVLKKVDNAVYDTISDVVADTFNPGAKTYNMANDGTGLAPFHETDTLISPAIKAQLEQVKTDVLAGAIDVHTLCPNPGTVKVGLVTDTVGINDNYFNSLSYQGLLRAQEVHGVIPTYYESVSAEDFAPNLEQCVADGNDLCVPVGWMLRDATLAVASDHPDTKFAIVDVSDYDPYPANLRGMYFGVEQPAYLAGVLSGLMSQTDVVGDLGGMAIPTVTAFTLPYRNGFLCASPGGTALLAYSGDFDKPDHGAQLAQAMISDGADVIFAPAGATGAGAVLSATQSGIWGIGVDTDYYFTVFGAGGVAGSDKLLTSVMKKYDNAVYLTIEDVIAGTFTSGTVAYGMENDGTGLAPFHETDALVSPAIKARLEQVKNDLLAGKIDVNSSVCSNYIFVPTIKR